MNLRCSLQTACYSVKPCALSVAGVSRSVTLVVAYIMTVTGRGWVESLAAVRAARPCAGPNLGFLRQLEEFENTELAEVSDIKFFLDIITLYICMFFSSSHPSSIHTSIILLYNPLLEPGISSPHR